MASGANSIKVVARFRPQNRIEIESGGQPIVRFEGDDTCTVDVRSREAEAFVPFDRALQLTWLCSLERLRAPSPSTASLT